MKQYTEYQYIEVESFIPESNSSRHGLVHIRPTHDQGPFKTSMFVQCNKKLSEDYPVGTKFRLKAKITDREGGTPFIYSNYKWEYQVIK